MGSVVTREELQERKDDFNDYLDLLRSRGNLNINKSKALRYWRALLKENMVEGSTLNRGGFYVMVYESKLYHEIVWRKIRMKRRKSKTSVVRYKKARKLPYFNLIPVIYFLGGAGRFFNGINLNYMTKNMKANFIDQLRRINENGFLKDNKIILSWNVLKGLMGNGFFNHSLRTYRVDRIRGGLGARYLKIPNYLLPMLLADGWSSFKGIRSLSKILSITLKKVGEGY